MTKSRAAFYFIPETRFFHLPAQILNQNECPLFPIMQGFLQKVPGLFAEGLEIFHPNP